MIGLVLLQAVAAKHVDKATTAVSAIIIGFFINIFLLFNNFSLSGRFAIKKRP
jgi:hypothetical protein